MKHLILSCLLIVTPVMAADETILSLTEDQKAACEAEGGCFVVTKAAAMRIYDMGLAQGLEHGQAGCKGKI